MPSIAQALAEARSLLLTSPSAELDAQVLLAHVLHKDRAWLYAWPEQLLDVVHYREFMALCARRETGEPVAYLTGLREFWSLPLQVSSAVLIPRPETETLVATALERMTADTGYVADLGTGSGAIALALATEKPRWQVVATERDPAAFALARKNIAALGSTNLQLYIGNWCAALPPQRFNLIVSNPPYIDAADPHLQQGDVRFEPLQALVAGAQGLADLRAIAEQARAFLKPEGWLLLEHGWQQGEAVRKLLTALGYTQVFTELDHGGRERVSGACWETSR